MTTTPHDLGPDFLQDQHRAFALLRETGPVRQILTPQGQRMWMVTRYQEARDALTDPALSKDIHTARARFDPYTLAVAGLELGGALSEHMLNTDPPEHTRLRRQIGRAFTSRRVRELRPRIEQIAATLLDDLAALGEADLLSVYAFPLPITVICELLGVPKEDQDDFRSWSTAMARLNSEQAGAAAMAIAGYLGQLIAAKRAAPSDDLLSDLITAEDDPLNDREMLAMAFLLLVAGHETTVNLIGNAVLALDQNPGQRDLLRTRPELLPSAIEEFLRYDGPITLATVRFALRATEIGGTPIPENDFVLISLAGANRDDRRFPHGEHLRVDQDATGHLAFGHGAHHCVGAPLARLEAEIALRALFTRFPHLTVSPASTLHWRGAMLLHGLETLPVRV
ncbi:cytochrome P450 family protein [Acrocarpospora phusangensis]|uniref:cytochrome P450 family protein n=1 Tax=Acrocarpospora phusangensis TaxID=1070424 RepID=UPI00194F3F24|nr:cytochrome P450 [Acrocarpospora phusangensis]